jgi:HSP20 family molecular chaperone IbpA|tara:strand:- start:12223 stop:12603 length:381 start_codon:yes stop_codon:yes gene_type:complete
MFGELEELLEGWLHMMEAVSGLEKPVVRREKAEPKHKGSMSYEEREKDIVFTIDMPGVQKKDISVRAEKHSISVTAENSSRNYNYKRNFKPTIDPDSAKATFTNGVLDITLTKVEATPSGKVVKIK